MNSVIILDSAIYYPGLPTHTLNLILYLERQLCYYAIKLLQNCAMIRDYGIKYCIEMLFSRKIC